MTGKKYKENKRKINLDIQKKNVAKSKLTIIDKLSKFSQTTPNTVAFVFIEDNGNKEIELTYRELETKAKIIAKHISKIGKSGSRIALLVPNGLAYVVSMFACILADRISVPLYPARVKDKHSRIGAVINDCRALGAITTDEHFNQACEYLESKNLNIDILNFDDVIRRDKVPGNKYICQQRTCYLQYTSGSTGSPKGAIISHDNLTANLHALTVASKCTSKDVFVNWLPLFHDLGLVNTLFLPVYNGCKSVILKQNDFFRKPLLWLNKIQEHGGSICGGPNFSLDHCVKTIDSKLLEHIDLSTWKIAFNAGETVRAETLEKFSKKFAVAKFKSNAHFPSYGMAEITVFLSSGTPSEIPQINNFCTESLGSGIVKEIPTPLSDQKFVRLVGCGRSYTDHELKIVDPNTNLPLALNKVGEIWVRGSSVANGYWGKENYSKKIFNANIINQCDSYLRTGDLGFIYKDNLYIVGRIKDTIIIRGTNYYPQDIEFVTEKSIGELPLGASAAFSIEKYEQEKLIVVQEIRPTKNVLSNLKNIASKIRENISAQIGLDVYALQFLRIGRLPKTSSGKVKRQEIKKKYINEDRKEYFHIIFEEENTNLIDINKPLKKIKNGDFQYDVVIEYLKCEIAESIGLDKDNLQDSTQINSIATNSLRTVQFQFEIQKKLSIDIKISDLFESSTLGELAKRISSNLKEKTFDKKIADYSNQKEKLFPLSRNQKSLWSINQIYKKNNAYTISYGFKLERETIDAKTLKKIWDKIIYNNEMLRARFQLKNGVPYQFFDDNIDDYFIEHKLYDRDNVELFYNEKARSFDLEKEIPIRVNLFARKNEYYLYVDIHHIIIDMHSMIIICEEFIELLKGHLNNSDSLYKENRKNISYKNFVFWQNDYLSSEKIKNQREYWKEEIENSASAIELITDSVRKKNITFSGNSVSRLLNNKSIIDIKKIINKENMTLSQFFLSCFKLLLYRYSGQDDIIVGVPTLGRSNVEVESTIGYFVNVLPIRTNFKNIKSNYSLLKHVKDKSESALSNSDYTLDLIIADNNIERLNNRTPIFQVMFVFQTSNVKKYEMLNFLFGEEKKITLSNKNDLLTFIPVESKSSQYELTLEVTELEEGIHLRLIYNSDLFRNETAQRMLDSLCTLINCFPEQIQESPNHIQLLDKKNQRKLYQTTGDVKKYDNKKQYIHGKFEEQVKLHLNRVAILDTDGATLTYSELNERSNRLARYLLNKKITSNQKVALYLSRSSSIIVSILSVLKIGATYIPLNPENPRARIDAILNDSQPDLIIDELNTSLTGTFIQTVSIDCPIEREVWKDYDSNNIEIKNNSSSEKDIAYIIYTSGSTGEPKGVMVSHENVIRLFKASSSVYDFSEQDVWTLFHSYSFDVSVWEIWGALFNGGKLVIVSSTVSRDSIAMRKLVKDNGVTVFSQTPSAFYTFMHAGDLSIYEHNLRYIIFGGEKLEYKKLEPWFNSFQDEKTTLVNMYGITETCVHATFRKINVADIYAEGNIIGKPLDDIEIYICNENLEIQPRCVIGEMYLTGDCVAAGYLNQPALTSERFFEFAFDGENKKKAYKSGDLAYIRHDGELCYVSRIDDQVKIRGFRIELGEIEAVLLELKEIEQAAVIYYETNKGHKYLVAYLVLKENIEENCIRQYIINKLPDYMLPSAFMYLDKLPLTNNGKLDKKSLPAHSFNTSQVNLEKPNGTFEKKIWEIWCDILPVESNLIGVTQSFFELSGDSIMAIQVATRAREDGLTLTSNDVFSFPTIRQQAKLVSEKKIDRNLETHFDKKYPLTPIQRWFFRQNFEYTSHWNQSIRIELKKDIPRKIYVQAIEELINNNTIFKSRFTKESQYLCSSPEQIKVLIYDIREVKKPFCEMERYEKEIQQSLDIEHGPICRASHFTLSEDLSYIFITAHHLIIDGVSWRILLNELEERCKRIIEGIRYKENSKLSYVNWAQMINDYRQSEEVQLQRQFWEGMYISELPKLPFLSKRAGSVREQKSVKIIQNELNTDTIISRLTKIYNINIQEILLSTISRSIFEWAKVDSFIIDVEHHGRECILEEFDVSNSIGWFTSIYPVLLKNNKTENSTDNLTNTKEQMRRIPRNGFYYQLIEDNDINTQTSELIQNGQILFNYLGRIDNIVNPKGVLKNVDIIETGSRSGDNLRTHPLEFLAYIENNKLNIKLNYDTRTLEDEEAHNILNSIKNDINSLAEFSSKNKKYKYTKSDFKYLDIDPENIYKIIEGLKNTPRSRVIEMFPLNDTQEAIFFHSLSATSKTLYFEQVSCHLNSKTEINLWKKAWQKVVKKHEMLRSAFVYKDDINPAIMVFENIELPWREYDITHLRTEEVEEYLLKCKLEHRNFGLNLDDAPLFNFNLYILNNNEYEFVWNFHHGIIDGWSMAIILRDVIEIYNKLKKGNYNKTEKEISLKGYYEYENIRSHSSSSERKFWREYLSGCTHSTTLLSDKRANTNNKNLLDIKINEHLNFPRSLSEEILSFLKEEKITLNHFIHSVFSILISYHSDEKNIIYGETYSGRNPEIHNIDKMVGLFIRTFPVRVNINLHQTAREIIGFHEKDQLKKIQNLNINTGTLYELSNTETGSLFDILLNVNNYPVDESVIEKCEIMETNDIRHHGESPASLTLIVIPKDVINMYFCYDASRYEHSNIKKLLVDIQEIASQICRKSIITVSDIFKKLDERKRNDRLNPKKKNITRSRKVSNISK